MANNDPVSATFFHRLMVFWRRFFRWLSNPRVFLGLIMLAAMVYLVLVPLFRMLQTTITYQDKDIPFTSGSECKFEIGKLPAGGKSAVMFAVVVDNTLSADVTFLENKVSIVDADSDYQELTVTTNTGNQPAKPGVSVIYTVTYANVGNQEAADVIISDIVPENSVFSISGSSPGWRCLHPALRVGDLTSLHWVRMLGSTMSRYYLYDPLVHSMTIAIGSTLLALFIGGALAWMVIRTDMPGRRIINQLAVIPYIMPGWTIAQAWTVMFKNPALAGGTPGVYMYLFGAAPPEWLSYGAVPIIISCALHYYTFFFLFVSAALMSIDSNLEEAGDLMGASRMKILRKITFPLVMPALLSGVIMTFSKVMGTYGGPQLLGVPVRYYTVATMIRANMKTDVADSFVMGIMLIMFAMITIYLNQRAVGTRKSYETIGGRGFVAHQTKLGRAKKILTTAVIIFQILVIILPLGLLLWDTFMLRGGDYSMNNFTLQYWIGESRSDVANGVPGVLVNPKVGAAAWNSVSLSLWTALITALVGVILGYVIVKGRGTRLSKLIEQVSFIPYVIPGIAFGAVYISMFAKPVGPIPALYGTFALLVVVSVAKHIPYSARSGVSSMMQVGRELEEAAQVSGANLWQRFRRIIFPLTISGFTSGFLMTFITTMRELSLIILLVTPTTEVLSSLTMGYKQEGDDQLANAVIIILIAIVIVGNLIIGRFRGGSLKKGLGM